MFVGKSNRNMKWVTLVTIRDFLGLLYGFCHVLF
ncbi:hypothetical protein FHW89_003470 [Mucilaginibacter sp. SG564]|nr:hypothetical protein [Mucilaginibacter sp. SG564]